MNTPPQTTAFAPTRWTLVLRARGASPEARAALADLCAAYHEPVRRFLRRDGHDEDAARELTQEFFARVLARGEVGAPDPARGRFRSYLLGAVKHFLADRRKHEQRFKRGGGQALESLDAAADHDGPAPEPADEQGAVTDAWFDRQWALAVMSRAMEAVAREFADAGRGGHFETLKPWLVGEIPALSQAEAGRRLGLNEAAVKVAVHRLRKRFREAIRAEILQTLAEGDSVEAELRYLVEVLTQAGA